MTRYVIKRLAFMLVEILLISFLLYFLYCLVPSNEVMVILDEETRNAMRPGDVLSRKKELELKMGLGNLIIHKYAVWMGFSPDDITGLRKGIIQGYLGYSYSRGMDIKDLLKVPMKNTMILNMLVAMLTIAVCIPIGVYTAIHAGGKSDRISAVGTVIGSSLPLPLLCLLGIFIFAVVLRIFPTGGGRSFNSHYTGFRDVLDRLYCLCLPVMCLSFTQIAGLTRTIRAAMIDVLSQDYIRTARSKGLKEKVVIYQHAWRNAFLAISTTLFDKIGSIFAGGSLVVETMFALNGTGTLLWDSLKGSEYSVVMAIEMIYIVFMVFFKLVADIMYTAIDPRIKFE